MNVRRLLVALALVIVSAGFVSAAPGDKIFDTGATGMGERGVAVFEGDSEDLYVVVVYLNMDSVAGLSGGDTILLERTVGARRIKNGPPVRGTAPIRGTTALLPH